MIIDAVRREVRSACERPENVLTAFFYDEHLGVVSAYATALARELHADAEVVELAAWLHDLSAVLDFSTLPRHAAASADLAGTMLSRLGHAGDRIAAVVDAIRKHGSPVGAGEGTPEAVCVSNADAMAQIARPPFWLYFAFRIRELSYAEGTLWYGERVRQNWSALIPEARKLVEREHGQALAVLAG